MSTAGGSGWRGMLSKLAANLRQRFGGLEVADQNEHRVVRRVIHLEELGNVFDGRGAQIFHRTDHRMLVSEVVVEQLLLPLAALAVRLVINTEPAFFLNGVALVVEVLFCDLQTLHAIGFEEESEIELVGGQDFEVVGAIFVGGAVHVAAVVEDEHEVFTRSNILGAFEHHVFKEVRKTGAAFAFIARTDVVGDGERHYGRGMIFNSDHAQAVL